MNGPGSGPGPDSSPPGHMWVSLLEQLDIERPFSRRRETEVGQDGHAQLIGQDEHPLEDILHDELEGILDNGEGHQVEAAKELQVSGERQGVQLQARGLGTG